MSGGTDETDADAVDCVQERVRSCGVRCARWIEPLVCRGPKEIDEADVEDAIGAVGGKRKRIAEWFVEE